MKTTCRMPSDSEGTKQRKKMIHGERSVNISKKLRTSTTMVGSLTISQCATKARAKRKEQIKEG